MRVLILSLALVLLAAYPCLAGDDWSYGIHIGSSDSDSYGAGVYYDGGEWTGSLDFWDNGLYFGYRDGQYHNSLWDRGNYRQTPEYNDRPGYRVYIPRGAQYPPQYYNGGYSDGPDYSPYYHYVDNGVVYKVAPYHPGRHRYVFRNCWDRGYRHRPLVIDLSYGSPNVIYANPADRPVQIYTAPDCPEYGYYRPAYETPSVYYVDPQDTTRNGTPSVYNDNRVYNYYYPDESPATADPAPDVKPAPVEKAGQPEATLMPTYYEEAGWGTRFDARARLETSGGATEFEYDGTSLYAADGNGPGVLLTSGADPDFKAFAYYQPGHGVGVIFREGTNLVAAYPLADGSWWQSPLSYDVDFRDGVNIGMVSGVPWVTFSDYNGMRYVVAFDNKLWQEVGSGS